MNEIPPQTELADYLGVTKKTVSEWTGAAYGPKRIRVGRRVFFRLSDVNEWVRQQPDTPSVATGIDRSGM